VAGSLWEGARFFLVLLLLALLLEEAGGAGPWVLPWLVFAGSGNLLVAAGGIMLAAFPDRYAGLIGLLRLGKAISVFSFLLLLLSGALGPVVGREVLAVGLLVISLGPVMLGVFALDLLFLAALLWLRAGKDGQAPGVGLSGPAETEVQHIH
jgi:hypothetical protein